MGRPLSTLGTLYNEVEMMMILPQFKKHIKNLIRRADCAGEMRGIKKAKKIMQENYINEIPLRIKFSKNEILIEN